MSEIRKVKCDRCSVEADLIDHDGDRPNGWCLLSDKDMCPRCHGDYKAQFAQMQAPTKEEIKAARALRKQGRALITQANKVLHKVYYGRRQPIRRKVSQKELAFRTWLHDYTILMPAVARTHHATAWSPEELAAHASAAADQMQREVAARRPATVAGEKTHSFSRKTWFVWQAQFDEFVHAMSAATNLSANAVIDRATKLADAMMKVVEKWTK